MILDNFLLFNCCGIMKAALIIIMVILGCVFMASVLMMSPKGGIGLGISGFSTGGNEYGSKKSIEGKLKIVAMVSAILFVGVCAFMPFVG